MKLDDMVLISADDHLIEQSDIFDRHLSADDLVTAPKMKTNDTGGEFWEYQGFKMPVTGLNAVKGRVPEEWGMEPTSLSHMRRAHYDARARLDDMNANGIAGALNFPTAVVMDGSMFHRAPDKKLAVKHMRAYNDWHIDEWCGAGPGRFIPCGVLPTWDMGATVAELKRLSDKGCTVVSVNENPTKLGLPSVHNDYWGPFWKACVDNNITITFHIGAGNPTPHASMETPIEAWISTMQMSVCVGLADWLNLYALQEYPDLKIVMTECGAGWVPFLLERADFLHKHHKAWTNSDFGGKTPSELFREHFMVCLIDDHYGLKNIDAVGENNIAYECDYPHSDSTWPHSPEVLWEGIKQLPDSQIDKVTHANAMKFYNFDLFQHHARDELTVGALRARAKTDKIDVSLKSYGGAKPVADGEKRRVTSGDIMKMNKNIARLVDAD